MNCPECGDDLVWDKDKWICEACGEMWSIKKLGSIDAEYDKCLEKKKELGLNAWRKIRSYSNE